MLGYINLKIGWIACKGIIMHKIFKLLCGLLLLIGACELHGSISDKVVMSEGLTKNGAVWRCYTKGFKSVSRRFIDANPLHNILVYKRTSLGLIRENLSDTQALDLYNVWEYEYSKGVDNN